MSNRARWWLAGEEECPHCGLLYVREVEFRCPDCDGPVCPHCVMRLEELHVCPDCACAPRVPAPGDA